MSTHVDLDNIVVNGRTWSVAYDFSMGDVFEGPVIYVVCLEVGIAVELDATKRGWVTNLTLPDPVWQEVMKLSRKFLGPDPHPRKTRRDAAKH